ncbi:MAG: VTT domain-containing protein [Planctomycetota bacterium]
MRALLKVMIPLAMFFGGMLLLLRLTGVLANERIEGWLEAARNASPVWAGLVVIGLMFADLFVAVPTLTIMLIAGSLMGFEAAAISGFLGLLSAGLGGYGLCRAFGDRLVRFIIRDEAERQDMRDTFAKHGVVMILLSRALPMMPEVTACLAGVTRMPLGRFLTAWIGSTLPYVLIATYAGSKSSLENPFPAIAAAVGLAGVFGLCWLAFQRSLRKQTATAPATAGR